MESGSMPERTERGWRWRAAALSMSAGLVHIVASPFYFEEWIGYGALIVTAGALQGIGAMALIAGPPYRFFYWAGVVANSVLILLWLITRTVGIPLLGPAAGEVWPVGLPDLVVALLELALIGHLVVLLAKFHVLRKEPLLD